MTFGPDDLIRERLFQPLVDRLGLDPSRTAWMLLQTHLGMLLTGIGLVATILVPVVPGMGGKAIVSTMLILPLYTVTLRVGQQLRQPAWMGHSYDGIVYRMLLGIVSLLCCVVLARMIFTTGLNATMRMATLCWSIAIPMALSALYLNMCRRPPPRHPKRSPVTATT